MEIEAGTSETCLLSVNSKSTLFPSYAEILNGTEFKVVMELDADYCELSFFVDSETLKKRQIYLF